MIKILILGAIVFGLSGCFGEMQPAMVKNGGEVCKV